jgi:aspartate racemase
MADSSERNIIGILGGMGPVASAEFLKTIYEDQLDPDEQGAPIVMMYSDPTFPDRTKAFLASNNVNHPQSVF